LTLLRLDALDRVLQHVPGAWVVERERGRKGCERGRHVAGRADRRRLPGRQTRLELVPFGAQTIALGGQELLSRLQVGHLLVQAGALGPVVVDQPVEPDPCAEQRERERRQDERARFHRVFTSLPLVVHPWMREL
jgi:hypothetical protein